MHELALCEGILQVMEEQAREQAFQRVRAVYLEIGALAGIEIQALRFGFEVVCRDSLAEGATLEIEQVPGQGWCMPCGREISMAERLAPCPYCGGGQIQVTGGDRMIIKELEVE